MPATAAQKSFAIDTKAIQKTATIYRAVHHPLRLKIIEILHKAGTINVTPIIRQLNLEQSLISAHLKILRAAKIVNTEKKGNNVFYSINYPKINRVSILAERLAPYRNDTSGFLRNADRKLILKTKEDTIVFTPMELKVIHLVCEQNSTEEIAQRLGTSKRTIEDHRTDIIKKMKVRNSVGVLFFAIKKGLFKV